MLNTKSKLIPRTYKLTQEIAEDLKKVCHKEMRNMSAVVRQLIKNYTQPRLQYEQDRRTNTNS